MTTFGELLRDERRKRGLSVRKLAEAVGTNGHASVTGQMITVLEKNRKSPSWRLGWALVQTLDVDDARKKTMLRAVYRDRMAQWKSKESEAMNSYLSKV